MTSHGPADDGEADASAASSREREARARAEGPGSPDVSDAPDQPDAPDEHDVSGPSASAAPARVRVTAPRPGRAAALNGEAANGGGATLDVASAPASERGEASALRHAHAPGEASALGGAPDARGVTDVTDVLDATDVQGVYVRSLIRSQLRLAVICAVGFAVATALFVLALAWAPGLDESLLAGVPVSWLLLGVGVYPLALTIAVLYVRAASRNESRYRSLAEES